MDWPERYAEALSALAGTSLELAEDERTAMLRLAREVAHRTERKFAPISTYLAGRFVAARVGQEAGPGKREAALREALRVALEHLPQEP